MGFSVSILLSCLLATTQALPSPNARPGRFSLEAVKVSDRTNDVLTARNKTEVDVGSNWYIPITIGTPPQSFLVLGDSGAPGFSMSSVFLPSNETTPENGHYNPMKSSTAVKKQGYTYTNCFGGANGHCGHGVVYNDVVTVGALSVDMAFEVSTGNNGKGVTPGPRGGNLGLNFDKNGQPAQPKNIPSWFQSVLPSLESGLWTLDYHKPSQKGTFDFGYIDKTKYRGDIGYTPVITTGGEWGIEFTGYQAGSTGTFTNDSWTSIVDSGTGGTGVPRSVVDGYFASVPGASYNSGHSTYQYACTDTLPDFIFGVGDCYRGVIPGSYVSGGSIGNGQCVSQLIAGDGTVIFGQNFIEAQFVVFDWDGARVGFANKDDK